MSARALSLGFVIIFIVVGETIDKETKMAQE